MIDADSQAATLYDRVRSCTRCPLSRTRNHAVPGEGPLTAEVMFIGEAPGMHEDRQGRPFVGAAGQFLDELLTAAKLGRSDVYICNVLKCRPPGNRDPLPNEIEACAAFLDEQIAMLDPAVIVSLGRYSMARYFPQAKISRVHGQPRDIGGRLFVPMFHPAAALHQQSLRETILEDFRRLPAMIEEGRALRRAANPEPLQKEEPEQATQIRLFE